MKMPLKLGNQPYEMLGGTPFHNDSHKGKSTTTTTIFILFSVASQIELFLQIGGYTK